MVAMDFRRSLHEQPPASGGQETFEHRFQPLPVPGVEGRFPGIRIHIGGEIFREKQGFRSTAGLPSPAGCQDDSGSEFTEKDFRDASSARAAGLFQICGRASGIRG